MRFLVYGTQGGDPRVGHHGSGALRTLAAVLTAERE